VFKVLTVVTLIKQITNYQHTGKRAAEHDHVMDDVGVVQQGRGRDHVVVLVVWHVHHHTVVWRHALGHGVRPESDQKLPYTWNVANVKQNVPAAKASICPLMKNVHT